MTSANTSKSGKRKPKTAWKKGQSGNPKGAPKRGESWAEVWTKIGNMTPAEAAAYAKEVAGQLAKIKSTLTLKEAVALRVFLSLMNEPTAGILNAIMDRTDGRPAQPVIGADGGPINVIVEYAEDTPQDSEAT